MAKEKIIRVGLKANANFLFSQMNGNNLSGVEGGILYRSIVYLNKSQFNNFKNLIVKFGGDLEKSLTVEKIDKNVDFGCYFTKGL